MKHLVGKYSWPLAIAQGSKSLYCKTGRFTKMEELKRQLLVELNIALGICASRGNLGKSWEGARGLDVCRSPSAIAGCLRLLFPAHLCCLSPGCSPEGQALCGPGRWLLRVAAAEWGEATVFHLLPPDQGRQGTEFLAVSEHLHPALVPCFHQLPGKRPLPSYSSLSGSLFPSRAVFCIGLGTLVIPLCLAVPIAAVSRL